MDEKIQGEDGDRETLAFREQDRSKDTHQDANADNGIQIRKVTCDGIL
jgi:hypothetical protein